MGSCGKSRHSDGGIDCNRLARTAIHAELIPIGIQVGASGGSGDLNLADIRW
jgi:hypothetical protein